MNDSPWPRGSDMAAITAKAAKGVTHVYTAVIAALAATSDPSHRGRSHVLLEPRLSLRSDIVRVLPRRPGEVHAPGQVSWLSDRPTPRAFPASRPVALAGFVPDYSDGVAAASHRLPWALVGTQTLESELTRTTEERQTVRTTFVTSSRPAVATAQRSALRGRRCGVTC